MKISEITNAQDKLDLLKSIMDNTWRSIAQPNAAPAQVTPIRQIMPAKPVVKVKPIAKIKKAPYAAPPNPRAQENQRVEFKVIIDDPRDPKQVPPSAKRKEWQVNIQEQ